MTGNLIKQAIVKNTLGKIRPHKLALMKFTSSEIALRQIAIRKIALLENAVDIAAFQHFTIGKINIIKQTAVIAHLLEITLKSGFRKYQVADPIVFKRPSIIIFQHCR